MEDNWKKDLVTDSYGNPARSISNLHLKLVECLLRFWYFNSITVLICRHQ